MAMQAFSILIVDTDKEYQEILQSALMKEGRLILAAYSSEEAVAISAGQLVNMIILDFSTSKQGGSDFMRIKFKEREEPDIPVFILSGNDSLQTKLISYVSGAVRFFPKPVDLEELLIEVEKYETKKTEEAIA